MYVVQWGVNNRIIVFCPISNIDKTTTPNASIYLDRVATHFQSCVVLWSFLLYQQPQAVINEEIFVMLMRYKLETFLLILF